MSRTSPMPCGTEAACCRHQRHHELVDEACRAASNRATAMRRAARDGREYDPHRETTPPADAAPRNGLPVVPYEYGARSYPWAERVLAAAEAIHTRAERDRDAGWEAA